MQSTFTNKEKLNELFNAIERRVTNNPAVFHEVIQVLKDDPALKALGVKMNGKILLTCICLKKFFPYPLQATTQQYVVSA